MTPFRSPAWPQFALVRLMVMHVSRLCQSFGACKPWLACDCQDRSGWPCLLFQIIHHRTLIRISSVRHMWLNNKIESRDKQEQESLHKALTRKLLQGKFCLEERRTWHLERQLQRLSWVPVGCPMLFADTPSIALE